MNQLKFQCCKHRRCYIGFFAKLFGQSPSGIDDEAYQKQRLELGPLLEIGKQLAIDFVDCDELPTGTGSFGTVTNPIPVNGSIGETVYLNRLRTASGVGFYYHRLGNTTSPATKHPVDRFQLLAADGSCQLELFFDMYHPRRSQKVPTGLTQTSWRQMDPKIRAMVKLDVNGSKSPVRDFPFGLPDEIENSPELRSISPGLGRAFADQMRARLKELRAAPRKPEGRSSPKTATG